MNNYLHGLPFHAGSESMSDCNCPGQAFDPAKFKLYSEANRFPTFVLRLPIIGVNPDLSYANECVRVFTCDGNQVASVTMEEGGMKLYKDGASYFLTYDGSPISGIKLECGKCHRLKISSFWSEVFWITDVPQEKIQLEFSNKSQLGDVPYQTPVNFVQRIMVDGEICSLDAELFESRESQANGLEEITYQRLTSRKALYIYNAPDFIQQLLGSIKVHDQYQVLHRAETLTPLQKRTVIDAVKNGCCDYDITLTMPLRDINIIGGACQSDAAGSLEEVEIPDDLPDSCEIEGDWEATEETLCLPFGQVPPVILPPIPPVGTPPVGTPCPPAGQVVNSNTLSVNCSMAFEFEGVKYRKKVTKQIADGSCGTTTQIQYIEPCTADAGAHTISSISCGGGVSPTPPVGTPPVGTPPVGTPPVGTPPVGTPPVGTPPVGTPPSSYVQKYRIMMGTTGSGFDASAEHGIQQGWIDRFNACNYSWGWGISGIVLWISWEGYEPTPGNFQSAALQRAISYCSARNLELAVVWLPKRKRTDGFITDDEIVKGSAGTQFSEGVPGFDSVYAGWGCDRVNALQVNAIKSVANTLKTYSKALYMSVSGGHAGEFVNHILNHDGVWEVSDFSIDNLARFNTWVSGRGIATPGTPPVIQGPGIDWPYPDFSNPRGLEFARFSTYNLSKHYRNFCNAVKSVSSLPCITMYAAASNRQLRATANAAMDYIAQWGDGMYGSEGDGLYDHIAKIRVNSVNLGTFPNGISAVEFDPDDLSVYRYSYGTTPPYCQADPQWQIFKTSCETLFSKGAMIIHFAMAFCEAELQSTACSQALQQLSQSYVGKPYNRPTINLANTVTCEVTTPYRNSQDIIDFYGVNVNTQYAKYTSADYWGGVPPEGTGGGGSNPAIDNFLNSKLADYQSNVLVDVKKSTSNLYSYTRGAYSRTTMLPVASLSKAVSAAVLLTLIDDGLLSLSTTVGSIISSWNSGARAGITLKQIISHTAGIPADLTETLDGSATLEAYVNAYGNDANFPLEATPGSAFKYSTHPYNIAGRMAEVVTGQTWRQLFESRIRNKCGMGDAIYNPKEPYQPISGNPNQPNVGHGLWITQQAYMNFMSMIRDGGVYNGVQVISTANLPLLWTDMTTGLGPWGFGMIRNDGGNEPTAESARGCYAWLNRSKQYAGVLFTQAENAATIGPNNGLRDLVRANY